MKFKNILNTYLQENNILKQTEQSEQFDTSLTLTEAKKSELYKDLIIQNKKENITAEDVRDIRFYDKGKNIKQGKSEEEIITISKKQADLYNQILEKLQQEASGNKTTLIELSAAAISIFRQNGQNAPTAAYNFRGVFTIFVERKKILAAAQGGDIDASAVVINNVATGDNDDASVASDIDDPADLDSNETTSNTKFDATLKNNEPANSGNYLKADLSTKIEKTDFTNREDRIDARYILDTLRDVVPGTYTIDTLIKQVVSEDDSIPSNKAKEIVKSLLNMKKISFTTKAEAVKDEPVDAEDAAASREETPNYNPSDIVDKLSTGSTRKGFSNMFDF